MFGCKIFDYYADKLKKVRRNCHIPYKYAKYLLREQNLRIVHSVGIVISPSAVLGKNCTIYQNVTIGDKNGCPTLGDNVTIYANSVVFGKINIGNNAVIGAGSVVFNDIPANEVWAGNPAHFIKKVSLDK